LKISPNGSWLNETAEGHIFDPILAKVITVFCKKKNLWTIIDLGAGLGDYIQMFNNFGLIATGYDGNPYSEELTNGKVNYRELHTPMEDYTFTYNLVLSLEVGEHIPQEYEQTFLDNVVKCAKQWIILSWAVPGQNGDGHVNCRDNEYIIFQMINRGFQLERSETIKLRKQSTAPWFKNTLMVFKKNEKIY
jgi:hypothetical protein